MLAQDLRGFNKPKIRLQGPISPDFHDQAIVIGLLPYPGIFRLISDPADRGERGINPDDTDLIVAITIFRGRRIAAALARRQLDIERDVLGKLRDMKIRIDNSHLRAVLNITGCDVTHLVYTNRELHLAYLSFDKEKHVFEVE